MAYTNPALVTSPKGRLSNLKVLFDGGEHEWSMAKMTWEGEDRVGVRWNGGENDSPLGNPQSRGIPTWFLLPAEIAELALVWVAEKK